MTFALIAQLIVATAMAVALKSAGHAGKMHRVVRARANQQNKPSRGRG